MDWAALSDDIRARYGIKIDGAGAREVGGGCINRCWSVAGDGVRWFLKVNRRESAAMFVAEARGLAALGKSRAIRVPAVVGDGHTEDCAYLLLEWIPLANAGHGAAAELGAGLAAIHRETIDRFGFGTDNFIGSTPQPNGWRETWAEFFSEQRLAYQLRLAARNGYGGALQELGAQLRQYLPELLAGHAPAPSLLHGDLWGGNWSCDEHGKPVIFDPAVYFGDREADLAMTRLFGGFGGDFYAAYEDGWPLPAGAAERVPLYNLYHILNHTNLFGGSYLDQAVSMMRRLLRQDRPMADRP